ncbi:MAG: tRNA uridine-5-carboxymethylaminomethyl(34) synthesis GTPase MnmE [Gammaproteobacteria bacterium]
MDSSAPADTIVACATAPGRGGVGIVRVSGPLAPALAQQLLGKLPSPRYAAYRSFRAADGATIDSGIALYFPAPHSFTGEDVLELQGHGGAVVMDMLQRRTIELGARLARPGEFSERAFLNGKIDLAQAEAIADLIDSTTEQAAHAATRSLQGEFSARVNVLIEQLIDLRMYVEAAIDFPEEEVDFLAGEHISSRMQAVMAELTAVLNSARQGSLLREGINVVIVGRPNVGKSSLLNRLAGRDTAIVTNIPGTTRDVLREHIHIDGLPLHIIDTAGLRDSHDQIEQEGMRRTWQQISGADCVLLIMDDTASLGADEQAIIVQLPKQIPLTIIHNKIDLSRHEPQLIKNNAHGEATHLWLSAKTGAGLDILRTHLKDASGYHQTTDAGTFTARRRHLDALGRAQNNLQNGIRQLQERCASELLAEDLRQAQNALSEITGVFGADDLLGRIFAGFCIGK